MSANNMMHVVLVVVLAAALALTLAEAQDVMDETYQNPPMLASAPKFEEPIVFRRRRQASLELPQPPSPGFSLPSPQAPAVGANLGGQLSGNAGSSGGNSNGMLGLLSDIGPTLEKASKSAQLLQTLFGDQKQQQQYQPQQQQQPLFGGNSGGQSAANSNGPSTLQLVSTIAELVRATQDTNKQNAANVQQGYQQGLQSAQQGYQQALQGGQQGYQQGLQSAQQGYQQGLQSAQQQPTGFKAALSEFGNGFQRIVLNNPNLLPEVRNLYQSVSSKLSSPSPPPQAAISPPSSGQDQLADSVGQSINREIQNQSG